MPVVAGHPGVDLVHILPEPGDAANPWPLPFCLVHAAHACADHERHATGGTPRPGPGALRAACPAGTMLAVLAGDASENARRPAEPAAAADPARKAALTRGAG